MNIVIGIIGLIIGAFAAWYMTGKAANSRAQKIMGDAEKDAIKKDTAVQKAVDFVVEAAKEV